MSGSERGSAKIAATPILSILFIDVKTPPPRRSHDHPPNRVRVSAPGLAAATLGNWTSLRSWELEYWRFDETGEYHGTRLAGDRLVGRRYRPIDIDELAADVLQGYSAALNLHLRWERGELGLYIPATGLHIVTPEDERAARFRAEARADAAETRAEAERLAAAARIRQLEAELRRLRGA